MAFSSGDSNASCSNCDIVMTCHETLEGLIEFEGDADQKRKSYEDIEVDRGSSHPLRKETWGSDWVGFCFFASI
jgi:hypothetical protein